MTGTTALTAENASEAEAITYRAQAKPLTEKRWWQRRWLVLICQITLATVFLCAWQWLPDWSVVSHLAATDRAFISSPSEVAKSLYDLILGKNALPSLFPYLRNTLEATIIGGGIGMAIGALAGLLVSSSDGLQAVTAPFIVAMNSVPRIALIPIVVVFFGASVTGAAVNAVLVVVFLVFFNAFKGGRSVPEPLLENARLLGASRLQTMRTVRAPFVLTWVAAAAPNAISFSLIAVVTTELLTGSMGVGALMLQAMTNLDASVEFALVVVLGVVGILLNIALDRLNRLYVRSDGPGGR